MTLAHWQKGDELLYKEFSSIFQNRIEDYGIQRMTQVGFWSLLIIWLDHLIYVNDYLYTYCISHAFLWLYTQDVQKLRALNAENAKACELEANIDNAVKLKKDYLPTSPQVYGYKPG